MYTSHILSNVLKMLFGILYTYVHVLWQETDSTKATELGLAMPCEGNCELSVCSECLHHVIENVTVIEVT